MILLAAGQSAASQAAPGALGFLVVAGMGLILFFLFRSMTKHLRKVRLSADDAAAPSKAERVSTGASATDVAANKDAGNKGS